MEDEIQNWLASGIVGAITVDTNVFDAEGKNIQDGNMLLLRQVVQAGKKLLFSEITVREMERHLQEKMDSTKAFDTKVLNHLKKIAPADVIKSVTHAIDQQEKDPNKVLNDYFSNVSATVIHASAFTSIEELINRYFAGEPPFEAEAKKKNEFPDAIALLTLEGWAKQNNTKVLCISNDGDWKRYSEKSEHLLIASQLKDVLAALVHIQGDWLTIRVRDAVASWLASEPAKLQLEATVQYELEDHIPNIDADSYCDFEEEVVELYVRQNSLSINDHSMAVLSIEAGEAVISVSAHFITEGKFSFNFFVRDSIDKDNVPLGYTDAESTTDVTAELTIRLNIEDFSETQTSTLSSEDVVGMTVRIPQLNFDLGTVGPDYSRDTDD